MILKVKMTEENKTPEFIEGFALSGPEVKAAKVKTFEIVGEPTYEIFEDKDTKEVKRRLNMLIKFNKAEVTYYPNKSSQSKIIAEKGRRLNDWTGFKGEFETMAQKIGSEIKDVIYIK